MIFRDRRARRARRATSIGIAGIIRAFLHRALKRGRAFADFFVKKDKSAKPKREKVKADPKHVAAARELRDRYLEQFNAGVVLPNGKYDVSRGLPGRPEESVPRQLPLVA